MTIPSIANLSYTIHDGPFPLTFSPATWSDLACKLTATYTATYDSSSTLPTWLKFDGLTRTITIDATSRADVGVHAVKVIATIP